MTAYNWLGMILLSFPIVGFLAVILLDIGWRGLLFVIVGTAVVMAIVMSGAYLVSLPA